MTGERTETMTTTFVAMAPNSWGKGATIEEAVKVVKRHVPNFVRGAYDITVYAVDGFDGVDGMGRIHYLGAKAPYVVFEGKGRKR